MYETTYYDAFQKKFNSVTILDALEGEDSIVLDDDSISAVECNGYIIIPTELFNKASSDNDITEVDKILCKIEGVIGNECIIIQCLVEDYDFIPDELKLIAMLQNVALRSTSNDEF